MAGMSGGDISSLITNILGKLVDTTFKGLNYADTKKNNAKALELQAMTRPVSSSQSLNQIPMLGR